MTERIRAAVAGLSPGYFAIVIASGSISIGIRTEGRPLLARGLFTVCVVAFVVLLILSVIRLRRLGDRVDADLTDWWSMVFPLGMYAIASMSLGDVVGLGWVATVGRGELWVAFAAWIATAAAMCTHVYRRILAAPAYP